MRSFFTRYVQEILSFPPSMTHTSFGAADARSRIAVLAAALTLVFGFHALALPGFRGMGLGLFGFLAVLLVESLAWRANIVRNRWAYLFLAPSIAACLSVALYASEATQFFGSVLALGSFMLYAYWLSAPVIRWKDVGILWPSTFFLEGVAPLHTTKEPLMKAPNVNFGTAYRVFLGVVIALPVLWILIALLASADPAFEAVMNRLNPFQFTEASFERLARWMVDALVGVYALAFGWLFVRRQTEQRSKNTDWKEPSADPLVFSTALVLVNAVLALFLIAQLGVLFGDTTGMLAGGLTYAQLARQGFFQLVAASTLLGGVSLVSYYATGLRERWNRILVMALGAQTLVVLLSAAQRLWLYVQAYGLTLERFWAGAFIVCIAGCIGLLFVALQYRYAFGHLVKLLTVGVLSFFSLVLLLNVEGRVARVNVSRFLRQPEIGLDVAHLQTLSADAYGQVQRALSGPWSAETTQHPDWVGPGIYEIEALRGSLSDTRQRIVERAARDGWMTLSLGEWRVIQSR